jgi:predicted kinase
MEAVIFCGVQGSGKTSFFRERFFDTHLRLNLDMLRTRHRENLLLRACLEAKQPFVVDNTNPTARERAKYIAAASDARFKVIGYYFSSKPVELLARNAQRPEGVRVPDLALLGTYKRLEIPRKEEGFDELYYVRIEGTAFIVEPWREQPGAELAVAKPDGAV